jgi:hypothetical protein
MTYADGWERTFGKRKVYKKTNIIEYIENDFAGFIKILERADDVVLEILSKKCKCIEPKSIQERLLLESAVEMINGEYFRRKK